MPTFLIYGLRGCDVLLKVTKAFTSRKRTYQVGEDIRVSEGQILMDRGYARALTKAEVGVVLDEYVKSAERLFTKELPEIKFSPKAAPKAIDQGVLF